jgi:hypothetical protein
VSTHPHSRREVAAYVERHAEARDGEGRRLVVRNGQARARGITCGAGTLEVRAPRVNDRRMVSRAPRLQADARRVRAGRLQAGGRGDAGLQMGRPTGRGACPHDAARARSPCAIRNAEPDRTHADGGRPLSRRQSSPGGFPLSWLPRRFPSSYFLARSLYRVRLHEACHLSFLR